jgi:hypothetical protein
MSQSENGSQPIRLNLVIIKRRDAINLTICDRLVPAKHSNACIWLCARSSVLHVREGAIIRWSTCFAGLVAALLIWILSR